MASGHESDMTPAGAAVSAPTVSPTPDVPDAGHKTSPKAPHDGRWSGVPLAASLALVAFAVLFGIYGPRVGDRATPPLGIPAWDLGEAAVGRHFERVMGPVHGEGGGIVPLSRAEDELRVLVGGEVRLPVLENDGWRVHEPRPVTLPGTARGAIVLFSRDAIGGPEFLSLVVAPDHQQYVVFSPFGRPLFLPAWDVYPIDLPMEMGRGLTSVLWSDSRFARILTAETEAALVEVAQRFIEASEPAPVAPAEAGTSD